MLAAAAPQITVQLRSVDADVAFSLVQVPPHLHHLLSLYDDDKALSAPADLMMEMLPQLEVRVAPDCRESYAKVSLDVFADGDGVSLGLFGAADTTERLEIGPSGTAATITYPFFSSNDARTQLRGRVQHSNDRLKPECAEQEPLAVSVTATVAYQFERMALAAWVPARSVSCTHTFTTNMLDANSEYALEISAPSALGASVSVSISVAGQSGSTPLATVTRTEDVIMQVLDSPGADLPSFAVSPIYMVPLSEDRGRSTNLASPLGGTLVGVQAAFAEVLATPSALIVELMDLTNGTQTVTPVDGAFSFGPMPPGMYQLRVLPGPSLPGDIRIVESVRSALNDDSAIELSVVFVHKNSEASQLVLVPNGALSAAVSLQIAFASSDADGSVLACHVFEGRKQCGDASWEGAGSSGQVVTLPASVPSSTRFNVYVSADRQLCSGFGRASSSTLPGGNDAGVDCVGDCSTGRSYCYAANGNLCGSCVLWEPVGDEVLCYDYGTPQGGPLPNTSTWDDTCGSMNATTAAATAYDFSCSCQVLVAPALSVLLVPPQLGLGDSNQNAKVLSWPVPALRTTFTSTLNELATNQITGGMETIYAKLMSLDFLIDESATALLAREAFVQLLPSNFSSDVAATMSGTSLQTDLVRDSCKRDGTDSSIHFSSRPLTIPILDAAGVATAAELAGASVGLRE